MSSCIRESGASWGAIADFKVQFSVYKVDSLVMSMKGQKFYNFFLLHFYTCDLLFSVPNGVSEFDVHKF